MGCTDALLLRAVFGLEWGFGKGRGILVIPRGIIFTIDFHRDIIVEAIMATQKIQHEKYNKHKTCLCDMHLTKKSYNTEKYNIRWAFWVQV